MKSQDRIRLGEVPEPDREPGNGVGQGTDRVEDADVRRHTVRDVLPAVREDPEVAAEDPVVPVESVDQQRDQGHDHRVAVPVRAGGPDAAER